MKEIFKLHGISKIIVIDLDGKFTSNFLTSLYKGMDTKLNFTTTYHPQIKGQPEWVNHILEDMLRMYVMNQPRK